MQKSKKGSKAQTTSDSNIRTPIVVVMGHVDHGKTSLLDKIRGTAVVDLEAGAITQHIGATEVPLHVIKDFCGAISAAAQVPGLLFIDTPGHHAFTSLRSRGGSLADLAVLIVDANEGFQPQTIESLQILKKYKTPFVVAANKIDRIIGWRPVDNSPLSKTLISQNERVISDLDTRVYDLVGELYKYGFSADRYDRIPDFTKTIGIVPISAITGEGVPDLLMLLVGLAQKFLKDRLKVTSSGAGVGTILEVKEERGLGTTLDVILYDGELKAGDTVVVGTAKEPVVTKIRALLKPKPLTEIRSDEKFLPVKKVVAASGVKVSGPKLESALAGSTLRVAKSSEEAEDLAKEMRSELESVRIETENFGIVLKTDTVGSLEALIGELKAKEVPIQYADVGPVTRRDIIKAASVKEKDPLHAATLAFNVNILPDALSEIEKTGVPVFHSDIIYSLMENYEDWIEEQKMKMEQERLEAVIRPGAIRLLPDCVFRQSKPAIVGVQVIGGVVRTQVSLVREDGAVVGIIKGIQARNENVGSATVGQEVAVAIDGPTVGRQVHEGDILYVNLPERHSRVVEQELLPRLSQDEKETFEGFINIKRKKDPFWGR